MDCFVHILIARVLHSPINPSLLFLCHQILSIEKAESTSPLPNPVIVSIRTKKAFQLIELQDRDELVESLNSRLRSLQWKQSMFRGRKDSKRSLVTNCLPISCQEM